MSVISHRKAEANNKYMSSYNPEKPSKFITYLDAFVVFMVNDPIFTQMD